MRGRPRCLLLRRFAPLLAVAALLGPTAARAGTPSPDSPPAAATLAPDPAPGASRAAPAPVHTPLTAPVVTAPVRHVVTPAKHVPAGPAHAKAKVRPRRHPAAHETRFVVPRIALPASIGVSSERTLHAADAVLAVLALVAAAAVAGSGARLVFVWHRGAGA